MTLIEVWQEFNKSVYTDEHPEGNGDIEGLIKQLPDGTWAALFGSPDSPGRVIMVSVDFNPFTGEKLPTKLEGAG